MLPSAWMAGGCMGKGFKINGFVFVFVVNCSI